jgi:hypothetical protein
MRSSVVIMIAMLAAAEPAHADGVVGLDIAGLLASKVGAGAYASAALRYGGDDLWVEPGVTLRLAQVGFGSDSHHLVEPMLGARVGNDANGFRPWMGGYIGYANHTHDESDGGSTTYTGVAFDAAIGIDFTLSDDRLLVFRLDLNHDETKQSFGSATWFALGVGLRWKL